MKNQTTKQLHFYSSFVTVWFQQKGVTDNKLSN